jgi:hypothetical protein
VILNCRDVIMCAYTSVIYTTVSKNYYLYTLMWITILECTNLVNNLIAYSL